MPTTIISASAVYIFAQMGRVDKAEQGTGQVDARQHDKGNCCNGDQRDGPARQTFNK